LWPDDLCRLFDRFGVEPRAEHAAATVDPCPGSLQYPVIPDRIPARYVPYNGPGEAPSWLLDPPRRRRVAVTWGTLTAEVAGQAGQLVPRVLRALAGFDTDVVVTLNPADRALLPPDSEQDGRVRIVQNLPLNLLLPSCDAIVHQGGGGTMLTAAALGVPQVLITGTADQTANAARMTAAAAGTGLHWTEASYEAIGAAISVALSEPGREAAARLRDEIRAQPTPAEVAANLKAGV
jgi:UDP:flavonoid glycosyltransferase YjiC (YdhE family)